MNACDQGKQCAISDRCGGCRTIEEPYSQQLATKDAFMRELFADQIAQGAVLLPIEGMDDPYYYRNKVTTPFAPARKRQRHSSHSAKAGVNSEILFGMYEQGTHAIVPKDECFIENKDAQEIIQALPRLFRKFKYSAYDEETGAGLMRHAIVRVGHTSGEILVTLVTNGDVLPRSKAFCQALVKECPRVTTIVQNINTARTNTILGQREKRLYGPGFILDSLCDLSFRISSRSFYQVNATQTEVLYRLAIELAELSGTQSVLDAYCGTGTIGLVAARNGAATVVGVDSVESAIVDARQNAHHNGLENTTFVCADAADFMEELAREGHTFDVVFLDPPRSGCDDRFLAALGVAKPKRIVYISCNPQTQRTDLESLERFGYKTITIKPVDMFPHTDHIESIAVLQR